MIQLHFLGEKTAEKSADQLGGKALALNELAAQGFSVPHGFVVSHDVSLESLTQAEWSEAVDRIGGFPVAVRSSGSMEDLAGASFAGQYVTFLDVATLQELIARIAECRAATNSEQVRSYLKAKQLDASALKMNVLIQRMVDARTAGVCFSAHPLTGREDHALIECCDGLGEKLVSGHISPNRYVTTLRSGSTVTQEIQDDSHRFARLDASELGALTRQALLLQAHFGCPQDIEWAIDRQGRLWVLQSRPITRIQWREDIEEYTNADFKDGGVSAKVCSPLMYSLYRDAMQTSMPAYLKSIRLIPKDSQDTYIDSFYGRPYWNASAIKRALTKVPGFDEKSFDHDLGIQKDYGKLGPLRIPTNVKTVLPALPVAVALEKQYKLQLELASKYAEPFLAQESKYLRRANEFYKQGDIEFFKLFAEILDFHQQTECDYFTTIYNNSNAQSDFKKVVEKISEAMGHEISLVRLMAGLSDVSHMKIQKGLIQLHDVALANGFKSQEWRAALGAFLEANYFHGDSELDLTVPRWGEDRERIRNLVSEMIASQHRLRDPAETIDLQHQLYINEKSEVLLRLERDWKLKMRFKSSFLKQLERSRAYLVARESMREFSTRSYHLVRKFALEAGQRWLRLALVADPGDVFMTTTDEIRAWIAGATTSDQVRENIAFRKLMYRGYRAFTPPDELGGSVRQRSAESYLDQTDGRLVLRGTGCSPGVIEGTVRLVADLSGAGALQKGEILVTRFTDPGWTPVLGVASGVVTEVGGLLSHAAVIGREYGIPAVLNIRGATQSLKNGQRVRVDGQAGTVEVL